MNTKLSTEHVAGIFSTFNGMDDEYIKLVRGFHTVLQADRYTNDYKNQARAETKRNVQALKASYIDKAKAVIAGIKEQYAEKPITKELGPDRSSLFDSMKKEKSLPLVMEQLSAQDKLAHEMQRNNNMLLWKAQLEDGSADDYKMLHADNKHDNDFMVLFSAELKKKAKSEKGLPYQTLLNELDNPVLAPGLKQLNELEKALNQLATMDYYPERLHMTGLEGLKYRQVDEDLSAVPILEGPVYRPIFDIKSAS